MIVDPILHARGALAGAAVLADRESFADGILALLKDPEYAQRLAAQAAANAARHTPQAFAAAMLDIYGKFVPPPTGPTSARADWATRNLDRGRPIIAHP